jgi:hypothetical protein
LRTLCEKHAAIGIDESAGSDEDEVAHDPGQTLEVCG